MATVYGANAADVLDSIDGVTNGGDSIYGFGGNDTLKGLGGDDHITGGYGADAIYGGSGTDAASYFDSAEGVTVFLASGSGFGGTAQGDTLFSIENLVGSRHDDFLAGDDGSNVLVGSDGRDTLKGGGGADLLLGGEGCDTLWGDAGADILNGGSGIDTMNGGAGDDVYYVDNTDSVTEFAGEGYDIVYSSALAYSLTENVELLSLTGSGAVYGTGNAQTNTIFGNINDNVLEGGGGADALSGLGGNDNFVFRPGDAHGDIIYEFAGNGAGVGDFMYFIGYGTAAQGASFVQLTATTWQINSADGLTHDVITLDGAPSVDLNGGDFVFL